MCDNCNQLIEVRSIRQPHQLFSLKNQIMKLIEDGVIIHVSGNCHLDDIEALQSWPQDFIHQEYACVKCGKIFELSCETYHGIGGSWKEK